MLQVAEKPALAELATHLPPTSLILCSRNRPQLLVELIQSILAGVEVPSEMVIVDDSDRPNDRLALLMNKGQCEVRYMYTHARGLSRANNEGIAAARNDLLVFTQDDVLVTPAWFGTLVRTLIEAGPRSVITGKVPPVGGEAESRFAPSTREDECSVIYEGRTGEGILYVQNMALYRSAFERIGRFDERIGPGTVFPSAEDNDLAYRLLKGGYRIIYAPRAVVYHRAWRRSADLIPLRWNYGLGRGAVYAKHLGKRDYFMLRRMARDVWVHLVGGLTQLRRERNSASGDLALAFGILVGATRWLLVHGRTRG